MSNYDWLVLIMAKKNKPKELRPTRLTKSILVARQFAKEYLKNDQNGTKAYLKTHPNATYDTARAEGSTTLARPSTQREIQRIVNGIDAFDRRSIEDDLIEAHTIAQKNNDATTMANIAMNKAKLSGILVDKHQDVSDDTLDTATLRSELNRRMTTPSPN